jgi:hypothetical protein
LVDTSRRVTERGSPTPRMSVRTQQQPQTPVRATSQQPVQQAQPGPQARTPQTPQQAPPSDENVRRRGTRSGREF